MLWQGRLTPPNMVARAPFDADRGAAFASNQGAKKPPLDSNGKSTRGGPEYERKGAARTLDRYRLQRHAAKILDFPKSLSACEYARRKGIKKVEVWRNTSSERGSWSRYVGLQTCKNLWNCPVCSNRRAWNRRQDLQVLVEYAQRTGLTLVMLTLTSSHDLETSLHQQKRMMKKAKASLTTRAGFKNGLGRHLVGSVTATEVTHGERSGWHLHFHYILLLDLRYLPPIEREPEAQRLGEMAWPAWEGAATRAGLYVSRRAWSVEVGEAVARYPADTEKAEGGWTLADEATRGMAKGGAGRQPFELLRLSCDDGDTWARDLFIEYTKAMQSVRALVWSRGLAELVGLKDEETEAGDEEKPEEQDLVEKKLAGELDEPEWKGSKARPGVRARRGRMAVAVAKGGTDGFELERDNGKTDPHADEQAAALTELGHPDSDDDIELIDDRDDQAPQPVPVQAVPEPPLDDFEAHLDWWASVLGAAEIEPGGETHDRQER